MTEHLHFNCRLSHLSEAEDHSITHQALKISIHSFYLCWACFCSDAVKPSWGTVEQRNRWQAEGRRNYLKTQASAILRSRKYSLGLMLRRDKQKSKVNFKPIMLSSPLTTAVLMNWKKFGSISTSIRLVSCLIINNQLSFSVIEMTISGAYFPLKMQLFRYSLWPFSVHTHETYNAVVYISRPLPHPTLSVLSNPPKPDVSGVCPGLFIPNAIIKHTHAHMHMHSNTSTNKRGQMHAGRVTIRWPLANHDDRPSSGKWARVLWLMIAQTQTPASTRNWLQLKPEVMLNPTHL